MDKSPRRGEVWIAETGDPPTRHWVVIVSIDPRNFSNKIDTVLAIPFGSRGAEGPTVLHLQAAETGLPGPSFLKGHFIETIKKRILRERVRSLSAQRMREVVLLIRRAIDPDAPAD
ncbi:MAG: type II toxin-antitoxin system PemK/MazF family toxin [Candidatus Acidiferrales bacterium]